MTTDKKNIQALAEACRIRGIRQVVFAPGSRSAPLVIALSQIKEIQCMVIPDERVAGFFALGMAQQSDKPVALVCTSGTAVLNFAPAICEAYYQQIPLLILTADRPAEYIGIGENQAINQTDIYHNYIKASYTLPESVQEAANVTAQAIHETTNDTPGPVHINIPLREPLYNQTDEKLGDLVVPAITPKPPEGGFNTSDDGLIGSAGTKAILICGMMDKSDAMYEVVRKLSSMANIAIITEPLSNIHGLDTITNVDAAIASLKETDYAAFAPDTIVTIGKQIVSKRIRQFLRKVQPENHYHLSSERGEWNGFGARNFKHINCDVVSTLTAWAATRPGDAGYKTKWNSLHADAVKRTTAYGAQIPFSDWPVFESLIATYPKDAHIQYGNSSPIRYAGFFKHQNHTTVNANRGTSGIDGCVSTAAGAALQSGKLTISIVGDVSFLYDSNALWNSYLSPHLRIIVINNGGGNIFRLIEGPKQVDGFEKYFETSHKHSAEYLAQMYQIPYYFCDRADDLDFVLGQFYKPQKGRPAILEIRTDGAVSEQVYKDYFAYLKM